MLILTTLFACFSSCGAKGQDSAQNDTAQEVVEDTAGEQPQDTSAEDTAGEDTAEEVVEENDTAGE